MTPKPFECHLARLIEYHLKRFLSTRKSNMSKLQQASGKWGRLLGRAVSDCKCSTCQTQSSACGAGCFADVSLSLPPDFSWVGLAACARCQQLQIVDLSRADILEILGSTFAHCSQLQQLRLSRNLQIIEQEAFFQCVTARCLHPTIPALHSEAGFCRLHATSHIL